MDTIHLCTAADKNYKLPLMTLLNSIYKNSLSHPCIMHVLCTGLSKRYQRKLQNKYKGTQLFIDFVDVSNYNFDVYELNMQYWTRAIFYRIMIPEIFKDIERVLYIDGDTLILQDLHDLYNTKFEDSCCLAMVVDRFSWKHQMFRLKTSNYFNSGVILFDIKKCRDYDFSYKCIKWLQDNPRKPLYPDQDAINVVCNNKIMRLNNLYNKMVVPAYPEQLDKKPFIIHFLSAVKPWMYKGKLRYCSFYRSYIPSKFQRNKVFIKQFIHKIIDYILRTETGEILQGTKILSQKQYFLCTRLVYTKTLEKKDIVDVIKKSRER